MAIFSRFDAETTRAIREMKRSGMERLIPAIQLPALPSLQPDVDTLGMTVGKRFAAAVALGDLWVTERYAYAQSLEDYASSLEFYGKALADYAVDRDPKLEGAHKVVTSPSLIDAIARASVEPETARAAEAASLANASTLSMFATALSAYALRVHTPEDRVFAFTSLERASGAIRRHQNRFS